MAREDKNNVVSFPEPPEYDLNKRKQELRKCGVPKCLAEEIIRNDILDLERGIEPGNIEYYLNVEADIKRITKFITARKQKKPILQREDSWFYKQLGEIVLVSSVVALLGLFFFFFCKFVTALSTLD